MARQDKDKEKRSKSLVPWRPFTDLTRWERDMDCLFKARASFKEGLLEVRMPKSEAAKRKETKIKVD